MTFMLAGLFVDGRLVCVSIGAVNVYCLTVDASSNSVNSPDLHHDVTIEGSQLLPSVYINSRLVGLVPAYEYTNEYKSRIHYWLGV